MDSISQLVLGAACGEAVLGKKIRNKALLWGAIAGTIPDMDVMLNPFFDPVDALFVHRGFSHSLLFPFLVAPVLGWIIHHFNKQGPASRMDWIKLFFLAIITHPLLDAMTGYGTSLFVPFSDYRVDISSVFIIDPTYTLPFLLCVIGVMKAGKNLKKRKVRNLTGLIVSTGYLIFTFISQQMMQRHLKKELENNSIQVNRMMTMPTPFNSIMWGGIAESDSGYYVGYRSWLDEGETRFTYHPRNEDYLGSLAKDPKVQKLKKFSKGYYLIKRDSAGLYYCDTRFGTIGGWSDPNAGFVFCFKVDQNNDGSTRISKGEWRSSRMASASTLWRRIKGKNQGILHR